MSEKRLILSALLLFLLIFNVSAQSKQADVKRKINILLAKMTL